MPENLSRIFIVSCLIFKSLSYFIFIFVYDRSVCSNQVDVLTSLHVAVQLSKKCKREKWLSEEALQIAVKGREAKSKGEKERYKQMNAEF